jgi:hypothetical protein
VKTVPHQLRDADRPYGRAYFGWYGLAWAGGTIAYQPFLSFLLPLKIVEIQGRPDPMLLSAAILLGGVAAGLANLGWGIAGDRAVTRGGSRRSWLAAGIVATLGSYVTLALASSATALLGALLCFQVALNLMLSALVATGADEVLDRDKGLLGGVLCIGAPVGAAASVVATLPGVSPDVGMVCVALLFPLLVLPFAAQNGRPLDRQAVSTSASTPGQVSSFAVLWAIRLVLQVATKTMFFFLMYYFAETVGSVSAGAVAKLTLVAATLAAPAALVLGRVSDRRENHRMTLLIMICIMVAGLVIMALQRQWTHAVIGYLLFASAAAICLALHAGYSMLELPRGLQSGKGLGLLNLTNTLPAFVVAGLGTAIVPQHGYRALCWILAVAVTSAAILLMWPESSRRARASSRQSPPLPCE